MDESPYRKHSRPRSTARYPGGGIKVAVDFQNNIIVAGGITLSSLDYATIKYNQFVGIIPINNRIPDKYNLIQNYPNPFNPSTVIGFQIPVRSRVTIRIYNLLGQEVNTLVDGIQDAGYKSVEWSAGGGSARRVGSSTSGGNSTNHDGSSIASGVYFYRMEATSVADPDKSFTQVRKLVLVR